MLERRILLIVAGGIAAYKSLELVRRGRERGLSVRCILTRAGGAFVTPLALASLSGDKVYQDLLSLTDEAEMGHIRLSRDADLVVAAPATADLMAKMAHGLADDLASTALLATDKPVLVAPAMNPAMWAHPATVRNVARLRADGIAFVGPNPGDMACGEVGPGRMAEPDQILAAIERLLDGRGPLQGVHVLVTSGPTVEAIDPVRFIANRSSGRQGHAIAAAAARAGADVTLVSGPVSQPDPPGVRVVRIESAREMLDACEAALPVDVAVFAAAVADWRPSLVQGQKVKKGGAGPAPIELTENPDILRSIASRETGRPGLVIGFAAETEDLIGNSLRKIKLKGCDWLVANDVSAEQGTFGGVDNTVVLLRRGLEPESWPKLSKVEVAARLVDRVVEHLKASSPGNTALEASERPGRVGGRVSC